MDELSAAERAEIAARVEAADPGPWDVQEMMDGWELVSLSGGSLSPLYLASFGAHEGEAQVTFCANARKDVPRLLSALGAETAAREAAEAREAGLREVANVLLVACEATLEGFDSCSQLTNSFPVLREIVSKARAALEAADEGGEGG